MIRPEPSLALILTEVARHTGMQASLIRGRSRTKRPSQARQLFCMVAREITSEPLAAIGKFLEGRDHTTILYAVRRGEQAGLREDVQAVKVRVEVAHDFARSLEQKSEDLREELESRP